MVAGDTAGAAARGRRGAATARRRRSRRALAAELYGLDILAENVEDEAHNTTRFIILSRRTHAARRRGNGPVITTFVFRVRNVPAALYKAMGGFATNGVNMTKLESYSSTARSSRPSSTPTSTAIPTTPASSSRWRSSPSSRSRTAEDPRRLPRQSVPQNDREVGRAKFGDVNDGRYHAGAGQPHH